MGICPTAGDENAEDACRVIGLHDEGDGDDASPFGAAKTLHEFDTCGLVASHLSQCGFKIGGV